MSNVQRARRFSCETRDDHHQQCHELKTHAHAPTLRLDAWSFARYTCTIVLLTGQILAQDIQHSKGAELSLHYIVSELQIP